MHSTIIHVDVIIVLNLDILTMQSCMTVNSISTGICCVYLLTDVRNWPVK